MKYFGNGLSEKHKQLNALIRKPSELDHAKTLFLEIHGALHLSCVSHAAPNETDLLLRDLNRTEYAVMPSSKDETIAWVLWHTARIEDLTMGILAAEAGQVFNEEWRAKIETPITDTGNALSDDELMNFSHCVNISELLNYRNEVGRKTRAIVNSLTAEDMKRKVTSAGLEKILSEGGVTSQEDSLWLLDFWGKKDVAGLLLMPPSRHTMLHLNDCVKWKSQIRAGKKPFLC